MSFHLPRRIPPRRLRGTTGSAAGPVRGLGDRGPLGPCLPLPPTLKFPACHELLLRLHRWDADKAKAFHPKHAAHLKENGLIFLH